MISRKMLNNYKFIEPRFNLRKRGCRFISFGRKLRMPNIPVTARSHNVPAQVTTWAKNGKLGGGIRGSRRSRFSLCDLSLSRLEGCCGTRLDQVTLLGDWEKADQLDKKVMQHLGATANWNNVGQVYPRSLDFEVVSLLFRLSSAPSALQK